MKKYDLEVYATESGKLPFQEWLDGLKDEKSKAKLYAKLERASFGHFGDTKTIQGARRILEMREHYGPGYRILFSIIENKIVLLLAGSLKRDQAKAIDKAKDYLKNYERRRDHEQ